MMRTRWEAIAWGGFVVAALLMLDVIGGVWYGIAVPVAACALAIATNRGAGRRGGADSPVVDRLDLAVVFGLYVLIVGLFRVAFVGFGTGRVAGLFLTFAAGLLLGVVGPIWYTVWKRRRTMASLGLGGPWRSAAAFGLLLATVQFFLTLWREPLPDDAEDWLPLLVMSLTVGAFETVFFRGFAQRRLESAFGRPIGIAAAAAMYALYHLGYGMGADEMVFLFGLGVVYAIAFAVGGHAVVLWPLLTPLGGFYNSLQSGEIDLPWASIAGFVDVLAVMAVALWLGHRHLRRTEPPEPAQEPAVTAPSSNSVGP